MFADALELRRGAGKGPLLANRVAPARATCQNSYRITSHRRSCHVSSTSTKFQRAQLHTRHLCELDECWTQTRPKATPRKQQSVYLQAVAALKGVTERAANLAVETADLMNETGVLIVCIKPMLAFCFSGGRIEKARKSCDQEKLTFFLFFILSNLFFFRE